MCYAAHLFRKILGLKPHFLLFCFCSSNLSFLFYWMQTNSELQCYEQKLFLQNAADKIFPFIFAMNFQRSSRGEEYVPLVSGQRGMQVPICYSLARLEQVPTARTLNRFRKLQEGAGSFLSPSRLLTEEVPCFKTCYVLAPGVRNQVFTLTSLAFTISRHSVKTILCI